MATSLCAKPFVICFRGNCYYQPQKLVTISCQKTETKPGNFYNILSLSCNKATMDEIKKAYRKMALKHHPDVCHTSKKEETEKFFVQLNEAYKVLSDPVSREEYDYGLSLSDPRSTYRVNKTGDQLARKRWEGQLYELKRQASFRAKKNEESWGRKMRAQSGKF